MVYFLMELWDFMKKGTHLDLGGVFLSQARSSLGGLAGAVGILSLSYALDNIK